MNMEHKEQLAVLEETIRNNYNQLSKRLKQVARYILDNSNSIAFDTVASIAEKADVPPSTLIRFANQFGFSGFNQMKHVFRQYHMETTVNYTERVRLFKSSIHQESELPEKPEDILKVSSLVNSQALNQLLINTSDEQLEHAINLIRKAENIYVIGLRRSFSIASYFVYALRHLELKAYLVDGIGGMYEEQLNMSTEKDVIVAISYSPYAKEVLELIQSCAKRGVKQISLTDSQVSPLTSFSDVCFVVKEAQLNGFRSQIASMSLVQSLIVALALTLEKSNQ